ncbi:hypothetical protein KR093_011791, partial [Drosophila rubida]
AAPTMFRLLMRFVPLRQVGNWSPNYQCSQRLSSKTFNTPRPPKDPPDEGYHPESVDHADIEPDDLVRPQAFRKFQSPKEVLGPGAGSSKAYKNPQYFGYHRFSYVELQNQAMELRDERRTSGGVQPIMGEDDEDECPDDSIEAMQAMEAECNAALKAQAKSDQKGQLKAWGTALEKKQEEQREVRKCEAMEKDKLQARKSKTEINEILNKGAKQIVEKCMDKIEKEECKENVIKKTLAQLETECKKMGEQAATSGGKGKDAESKKQAGGAKAEAKDANKSKEEKKD